MDRPCMITEEAVPSSDDQNITIFHQGRIVGVVSAKALDSIKTLKLVFTRTTPAETFKATQGQCLEVF